MKIIDYACLAYRPDFDLMGEEEKNKIRTEACEWLRAFHLQEDFEYRSKVLWCQCTSVQRIIHNGCKKDQLERWAENLPKKWDSINPDTPT
jgi:hypothetical protein